MSITVRQVIPSMPLAAKLTLVSALLLCASAPARAGWFDNLFGQSSARDASSTDSKQRLWRLHEFTSIGLVPREAGAAANQQPVTVDTEALRKQLSLIQFGSQRQALFASDELSELPGPLAQALAKAGPGDDILLLSSSRRDGGILAPPTAVTARVFVQGGSVQFIVHDARFDFYDQYRGTYVEPKFTFGSRSAASNATVQGVGLTSQRPDWLAIPLAALSPAAAAAGAAPAQPAAAVMPASVPAQVAPAAVPVAPATAQPVQPRRPLDAAGAEDIERRLETLKRLRDRNLITEEEYQQKRKEILQLL